MIRPLAYRLLLSLASGLEYVAAPIFAVVALLDAPPPPEHYGEEVLRCRRCCKPRVSRYLDAAGVCCAPALDQAGGAR